MARVICAVLKYTDEETLTIVEQEKLRQSVRVSNAFHISKSSLCFCFLALAELIKIIYFLVVFGFFLFLML